jgi:tetratricopeptide (TPR) repeat protein
MLGDFRKAAQYFQKLVRLNPMNSVDFQWLGRAWARWADMSNPFSAPGYSAKARKSLERAVELDPWSITALNELLDLYLDRRGLDKAQAIADRIGSLNPAEGIRAQGRVQLRRRELKTPEEHVRMAIDQIPHQVGRAVDVVQMAP